MEWLKFTLMIIQMVPGIIEMILKVQQAIPAAPGIVKHDLVLGSIMAAVHATPAGLVVAEAGNIPVAVGTIIDRTVAVLKASNTAGFTADTAK